MDIIPDEIWIEFILPRLLISYEYSLHLCTHSPTLYHLIHSLSKYPFTKIVTLRDKSSILFFLNLKSPLIHKSLTHFDISEDEYKMKPIFFQPYLSQFPNLISFLKVGYYRKHTDIIKDIVVVGVGGGDPHVYHHGKCVTKYKGKNGKMIDVTDLIPDDYHTTESNKSRKFPSDCRLVYPMLVDEIILALNMIGKIKVNREKLCPNATVLNVTYSYGCGYEIDYNFDKKGIHTLRYEFGLDPLDLDLVEGLISLQNVYLTLDLEHKSGDEIELSVNYARIRTYIRYFKDKHIYVKYSPYVDIKKIRSFVKKVGCIFFTSRKMLEHEYG